MKRLVSTLAVLAVGVVLTPVATAQDLDAIRKETLEHFVALNAGDAAAHVQHHMPQASSFGPAGGLLQEANSREEQRTDLQAQFDTGFKFNLQLRHLKVKVYGDAAVVTGYVVGTVTLPDGSTQQVMDQRTAVLIKQGGQWKEVHSHSSPVAAQRQ